MAESSSQAAARKNLKKNQACLQCRRGKMKCDAARPNCTNCVKAWQLLLETPGVPGSSAPQCDYDKLDGLIFQPETIQDPAARVRAIQDQLAQLHGQLQEARDEVGELARPQSHLKRRPTPSSRLTPSITGGHSQSQSHHHSSSKRRRTMDFRQDPSSSEGGFMILPPITNDPLANPRTQGQSPGSRRSSSIAGGATARQAAAAADLPPTETLEQLVELFIANEPHASRIFHTQGLREACQSTSRLTSGGGAQRSGSPTVTASATAPPAAALMHAICASAARYVAPNRPPALNNTNENTNAPGETTKVLRLPPGFAEYHADRARKLINAALTEHQDSLYLEQDGVDVDESSSSPTGAGGGGAPTRSSTTSYTTSSVASSSSSSSHSSPLSGDDRSAHTAEPEEDRDARKRRIRSKRDAKLFADAVQPLVVLAAWCYAEGKGMEVWADVGALTRAIMSLGLNHPPTSMEANSPKATIAQEERKRAFWSTFMLDRLLSAGGWSHSMAEEDSVKNFEGNSSLLSAAEFRDLGVQRSPKPQQPQARLYVQPKGPDSYSLLVDAIVSLGKITDFRMRARLNHRSALAQSIFPVVPKRTSPASSEHEPTPLNRADAPFSLILARDPGLRWEFSQFAAGLNGGVGYWSNCGVSGKGRREGSMPLLFKYSIGLADASEEGGGGAGKGPGAKRRSMVDMDLFLAHMVHYAATILLHFPVASFHVQRHRSYPHSHQSTPPRNDLATVRQSLNNPMSQGPEMHQLPHIQRHSPPHEYGHHQQQQQQQQQQLPSIFHSAPPVQAVVAIDTAEIMSASCMSDSRKECVDAARKIVDALALLRCTTFDISHVHPFGATCWYIAGVVLLYEHRRWLDEGDIIQQTAIAKDIQILRLSLLKYGQRAAIGTRLEEQLAAIQERIAASQRASPSRSEDGSSPASDAQQQQEYRHDVIPVFPFDEATYQSLPKSFPSSWACAPLPQALA